MCQIISVMCLAAATFAFCYPRLFFTLLNIPFIPGSFHTATVAELTIIRRSHADPCLVMPPPLCLSALSLRDGARPAYATSFSGAGNLLMSTSFDIAVCAVTWPVPGRVFYHYITS